jgi:hypothetical protein
LNLLQRADEHFSSGSASVRACGKSNTPALKPGEPVYMEATNMTPAQLKAQLE